MTPLHSLMPVADTGSAIGSIAKPQPHQIHLRLLETTDLHVNVFPYDYYTDQPDPGVGLAHSATLIDQLRGGAANTLLFDNGDFLQGNPMGDYIATARGMPPGARHPIITAMNALGYDGATLGNHDFNYGLDFLMNTLAGAAFPYVCANALRQLGSDPLRDTPLLPPYLILDRWMADGAGQRHLIRVGLIGFVPPLITAWDHKHLHGRIFTRDIVQTAAAWVPRIKAEGANIILALAHSGISPDIDSDKMENACLPLARIPGIDALMMGHSHLVFPSPDFHATPDVDPVRGTVAGKPATMAGFWGSHVGLIDLLLEHGPEGWQIAASASAAHPIARRNPPQALVACTQSVLAAVAGDHEDTLAYMRETVGWSSQPLHSYFALVADVPAVQIVAAAQRAYTAEALKFTPYAGLPVLAAAAPFKAGGRPGPRHYIDIPPGDLARRNLADLYIFSNLLRAVKITGAQVADWLERAVGLYNQILPGTQDAPLINPDFPSYNFDMLSGVTYQINLSQPSKFDTHGALLHPDTQRITALCHLGNPIQPDAEFVIATNDYRAHGGGGFPGADGSSVILESQETNRDVLLRHIIANGINANTLPPSWRFAPMPGTSALFLSGPGALAHMDELECIALESAGPGPNGFTQFRIRF